MIRRCKALPTIVAAFARRFFLLVAAVFRARGNSQLSRRNAFATIFPDADGAPQSGGQRWYNRLPRANGGSWRPSSGGRSNRPVDDRAHVGHRRFRSAAEARFSIAFTTRCPPTRARRPHVTVRGRRIAACAVVAVAAVALAACGSKTGSDDDRRRWRQRRHLRHTIKVGLLNSLSGTMAISEVTVRDSHHAGDRRDQRQGRGARQEDPAGRRGRRLGLADLRREGREADQPGPGRRRLRLLDLGQPQGGQAGLREEQGAAVLPGAVRGPGTVALHLLHRRHHQPADRARPGLPQGAGQDSRSTWSAATTSSRAPPTRSSRRTRRPTG